jgi:hypothetical protein
MKKRVRIYKPANPGGNTPKMQGGGASGMQQANPQQEIEQTIKAALIQGQDPSKIYNTLVKKLAGKLDPKLINQMVSAAVDALNADKLPHPEEELDMVSGVTQDELDQDAMMAMQAASPTGNAMITNEMLLGDFEDEEEIMKMGGPVSKKKFVRNVINLAKKQMGDAGKTKGAPKASIKDTAEADRGKIGLNFREGLKEAATIAEVKQNAEAQYDQMMNMYQAQFGGFVDGKLQKFTCGGKMKYQTQGEVCTTGGCFPNTKNNIDPKERERWLHQMLNRGYGDGAIGQTPQGMPIYPGIFDKKATAPRRKFRDLYPFNRAVEYIGSYGQPGTATDIQGRSYTGGINYEDAASTEVHATDRRGRPKEWTTYYNVPYGQGSYGQPTGEAQEAIQEPMGKRGRISRKQMEGMSVDQMRDAIDAGYKMPDQGNIFQKMRRGMPQAQDKGEGNAFQRMWWKMRQGRPHQAQFGEELFPEGDIQTDSGFDYSWDYSDNIPENPYNEPVQYEVSENMGGEGTPFGDQELVPNQVGVNYSRKDMYNVDPEAGLQQFNALANFGIGLLERRAQAPQEKWITDQLNADNLYGSTRKRKLGDWDQWGNFRPDQQGFRGVAQTGGQTPAEGAEIYMSEEEIQRFIDEGGELEFI